MTRPSVFITGAAAGIGRAIAEHFAKAGWFVGATDRQLSPLQELQDELGGAENCFTATLDVCDSEAWPAVLKDFIEAAGGELNVLINNAGVLDSGPFQEISLASHHRIVDINIKGVINGCHAAFPWLQQSAQACIINLASASAIYGQPSLASYAASKFAVRGLTEGLNLEWESQGIRVLDIWPLFVQTAMVKGMKADSIERMGVKLTPNDVAKVALKAAQAGPKNRQVHWTVGFEAGAFASAIRLLPGRASRALVRKLVL